MANYRSKKKKNSKFTKLKTFFLCVFCIHFCLFLVFVFNKLKSTSIAFPLAKIVLIAFAVIGVGFLYYFTLRRMVIIQSVVAFLINIFTVLYISTCFYFLVGLILNPIITITQIHALLSGYGLKRAYVGYDAINNNMKLAVIAAEDQRFPDHDGFDVKAIQKAMKYNSRYPAKQRGASTISQQTAKNIFLWQGGGFFRKGLEAFFTFSIENIWPKQTILARYLNIAEMGKGIFGVQAASKIYFNKNANALTATEAAQIAACLPNPKKYTVRPMSKYVAKRYPVILAQMNIVKNDEDVKVLLQ